MYEYTFVRFYKDKAYNLRVSMTLQIFSYINYYIISLSFSDNFLIIIINIITRKYIL